MEQYFDGRYVELDVLVIYIYIYGTRFVDGIYIYGTRYVGGI